MISNFQLRRCCGAIALLLIAACGDDDEPTGVSGEATVASAVVTDNPSSTSSSGAGGSGSSTYSGTLTGTVETQISVDGQSWVSLGQPRAVSLSLQSTNNSAQLAANVTIPAGTYAYVRLVFNSGLQAQVSGTVGGTTASGTTIAFGSGQVVIQKQIQPVTVSAGTTVRVVWDLNSELWLTSSTMQSRTAASAAFQAAAYAAIIVS